MAQNGFLYGNNFQVSMVRFKGFKLSVQSVTIPGINMSPANQENTFQRVKLPGDAMEVDQLTFSFTVDSELNNYMLFMYWIRSLTFPESHADFSKFIAGNNQNGLGFTSSSGNHDTKRQNQFSDISVFVIDSQKNAVLNLNYKDCFPVNLSSIDLTVTNTSVEPVVATVSFEFSGFDINSVLLTS